MIFKFTSVSIACCFVLLVLAGCGTPAPTAPGASAQSPDADPFTANVPQEPDEHVNSIAFSSNGRFVIAGGKDGTLFRWDPEKGTAFAKLDNGGRKNFLAVALSPDNRVLLTVGDFGRVLDWRDPATGKIIASAPLWGGSIHFCTLEFSKDGKYFITTGGRFATIWNSTTRDKAHEIERNRDDVHSAAFSPSGDRIVVADSSGLLAAYDTTSGNLIWKNYLSVIALNFCQFCNTGQDIVAVDKSKAKVWQIDASNGKIRRERSVHKEHISSMALSPDGKKFVTTSWDNTCIVWDANSFAPCLTLSGHFSEVTDAQWTPDGKRIVSGGWDDRALIWDAETGKLLSDYKPYPSWMIFNVRVSPNGKLFAILNANHIGINLGFYNLIGQAGDSTRQATGKQTP